MPHLRRLRRIAASARVTLRITTDQRNLLLAEPGLPKNLGHLLARAAVRGGKLQLQLNRVELDQFILSAGRIRVPDKAADRALLGFLAYLESRADRFEEPEETPVGADDQP